MRKGIEEKGYFLNKVLSSYSHDSKVEAYQLLLKEKDIRPLSS